MTKKYKAREYKSTALTPSEREELARKLREARRYADRPGGYENSAALFLGEKAMKYSMPLMPNVEEQLKLMTGIRADLWRWIESYEAREKAPGEGFELFKRQWKVLRLGIGLQTRLLVEQILFDRGKPWASLCTGFGQIS